MMNFKIPALISIYCALFSFYSVYAQSNEKPNVIIIYMDDMGYGDIEAYGMTGVPTPNLNSLASQGIQFSNFEVAQPICTASRAALLTGTYPNRIGMSGVILPWDKYAMNPEEETIADLLKENDYSTALYGKWHLGNKPPYFPTNYGFDEFIGIPYSHDIWPVDYDGETVITDGEDYRSKFPELQLYDKNEPIEKIKDIEDAAKLTTLFTEESISFIERNAENPFFLYLAHPMPHAPLAVSEKFKGKSEMGLFGDVIMEIDWSVGEITKTLDEHGLADNTILIFASDNGPWLKFGNHAGSTGGLREGKSTTFEGGNRVPFLIRWPNRIAPGQRDGSLFTNMDLLPTIAEATGSALPQNKIDGVSYLDYLTNEVNEVPRDRMFYYFGVGANYLEAIRYKNWKLIFPHDYMSYEGAIGKDGYPGTQQEKHIELSLYDLAHDPGERHNLIELYPEVVEKLQNMADQARADLGDDLQDVEPNNVREPARYGNN